MRIRFLIIMMAGSLISKGQEPMKINAQNSASLRWLSKEVLDSRILDDMETTGNWVPFTNGAISVVDARVVAKIEESKSMVTVMKYSIDKAHNGKSSLLMKLPSKMEGPGPKSGRGWGTA